MKDYKEILEGVVSIINTTEKSDIGFVNICAYIGENCPELVESKNEKVKKAIFEMVYDSDDDLWNSYGVSKSDVLAWLEVQSEHANFRNKIQIGDKVTRNEGGVLVNISQLNRIAKERRKQGEQKEINLVEILKDYPKETELYSPLYGKLWLAEVDEKNEIITCYKHLLDKGCIRAVLEQEDTISFYSNGTTGLPDFNVSKDCMLFLYNIEKQGEQKHT